MRERRMGKGASWRAGVGWVRRATFSASCLLMGFGGLDRGDLGQYQGSGRIGWADRWNSERALLLVHVGLGGPAHFLAKIAYRFTECYVAIPVGIGLTAHGPQQIVGEQAMPMLVVLQSLSDAAGSDDMEGRASRGIPLREGGLGSVIRSHTRHNAIEQKHRLFRFQARQCRLKSFIGYVREVVVAVPSYGTKNVSPVEETEARPAK